MILRCTQNKKKKHKQNILIKIIQKITYFIKEDENKIININSKHIYNFVNIFKLKKQQQKYFYFHIEK